MKLATVIRSLGTVERFAEAHEKLKLPADYIIVIRGVPRAIVMLCPDGCGETITVNLDRRIGPAWKVSIKDRKLTLYPSVWRESGCRAHFIVWRDNLIWCGPSRTNTVYRRDPLLTNRVLEVLVPDRCLHYEEIATRLDESPWDISWTCDRLVAEHLAIDGGKGKFKKKG